MAKPTTSASGAEEATPPPPGLAHYQSAVRHQCQLCTGTIHMERGGRLGCARHMREHLAHQLGARVRRAEQRLAAFDAAGAEDAPRREALLEAISSAREQLEADRDLAMVEEAGDLDLFVGRACPVLAAWDAAKAEGFDAGAALLNLDDLGSARQAFVRRVEAK